MVPRLELTLLLSQRPSVRVKKSKIAKSHLVRRAARGRGVVGTTQTGTQILTLMHQNMTTRSE